MTALNSTGGAGRRAAAPPRPPRGIGATVRKLRPGKVRLAVRRRRFEHALHRTPLEPCDGLVELGTAYGGWIVPGSMIDASWTCYAVGMGADITFDRELIEGWGVRVRAMDAEEGYVRDGAAEMAEEPRYLAVHAAIATADGPLRMQVTHDRTSNSVSSAGLYETHDYVEAPGRTLPSLMAELGDERIDLLKLDIEGAEYDVVPTLDLRGMGVRVLAIQFHHTGSIADARRLIAGLREQGYRPVACRPAVKLTFVRRDG